MKTSDKGRADVELTIQIGAETEAEALAILKDARAMGKRLLRMMPKRSRKEEKQFCIGAIRVTVRRPNMESK